MTLARTPQGQKMVRYSLVSVVSVIVGEAILFGTLLLHVWSASMCNVVAVCISAIPSYYLNRTWAWGKTGKSHFLREVVPFWSLALLGLLFSTLAVDFVEPRARSFTSSHLLFTVIMVFTSIGAFGVLWVAKFFIFNKVMFVHHLEDLPEALDGRTGVPT